jgi:hypothetical protein
MLQVTPVLAGSFATVAVKSWLPPASRLTVAGTTETAIGKGAAGSPPQPEASATGRNPEAIHTIRM